MGAVLLFLDDSGCVHCHTLRLQRAEHRSQQRKQSHLVHFRLDLRSRIYARADLGCCDYALVARYVFNVRFDILKPHTNDVGSPGLTTLSSYSMFFIDLAATVPFYIELFIALGNHHDVIDDLMGVAGISLVRVLRLFRVFRIFKVFAKSGKVCSFPLDENFNGLINSPRDSLLS